MAKEERIGLKATVDDRDFQRGMKRYNRGVSQMESGTTRAANSVNSALTTLASGFGLYLSAQTMIQFGKASHDAAVKVEQLSVATNNLAKGLNTTGDAMVESIQAASAGTIDRLTAMQVANKAMLFGIIESKEEMGELTRIAITLGAAMGQDATKSLDDLTVALGRNSPMILDNLGISLKLEEAHRTYAESIGKTVEQLTEEEKAMAFRKAALIEGRKKMEELGGVTETSAIKAERLSAAWKDFQAEFGGLTLAMDDSLPTLTSWVRKLEEGAAAWNWIFSEGLPAMQGYQDQLILTSDSFDDYTDAVVKAADGNMSLQRRLTLTRKAFAEQKQALEENYYAGLDDAKMLREMSRAQEWAIAGTRELTEATRRQEGGLMDITNATRLTVTAGEAEAEILEIQEQAFKDAKEAALGLAESLKTALINAYNDLRTAQTDYILDMQQGTLDAETSERTYQQNRAGIAQQGNDNIAAADEKLKDELAAAEEDWNVIRTQLLGDWDAKGQEQTEADLAWHKAIYENRVGAAHVAHAAELKEAEAASTQQTATLAAGYETQKADAAAALQEMTILKALSLMEATGALEELTGIQGITAQQAYAEMKAGTIKITDDMEVELARMITELETKRIAAEGEQEAASATFAALMDADTREAKISADAINEYIGSMATGTVEAESAAGTAWDNMMTDIDAFREKVETALSPEDFEELGIDSIDGIIEGVESRIPALEGIMFESGEAALAAYKRAIEGGSPAAAFIPLGTSMIDGIILGMEEEKRALDEEAMAIIDSVIMDMLEEAKKIGGEVGPSMIKDLRIIFKQALSGLAFETGETVAEASRRVFNEIVAVAEERWPQVTGKLGHLFNVVLEDLGDEAERVILTIAEQMSDLLSAASIFGRVGASAAAMLRTREITPAEERIRQMEDELGLLEDEGIELEKQAELVAEIAVERAKVAAIESDIAALEQQRQTLRMLEDQMALLDMIAQYGLDAQEVLGGITLGRGADPAELLRAMTGAYEQIIGQVQAQAFEPLGYRYTPPASPGAMEARAGAITTVGGIQIGPNTISDQVGMDNFVGTIQQVVLDMFKNG